MDHGDYRLRCDLFGAGDPAGTEPGGKRQPCVRGQRPYPRRNGNGRRRGLLVNTIGGQAIALRDLVEEERNVVICGEVVSFDSRLTRTGKTLIMFDLYDGTDTLSCKAFWRNRRI